MCSEVIITLRVGESLTEPWVIYEALYFFCKKVIFGLWKGEIYNIWPLTCGDFLALELVSLNHLLSCNRPWVTLNIYEFWNWVVPEIEVCVCV